VRGVFTAAGNTAVTISIVDYIVGDFRLMV
jgi:hypothetical protein